MEKYLHLWKFLEIKVDIYIYENMNRNESIQAVIVIVVRLITHQKWQPKIFYINF